MRGGPSGASGGPYRYRHASEITAWTVAVAPAIRMTGVPWVWWQIALTLTAPDTAWHALLLSCAVEAVVEVRHWLRLRRLRRKLTPAEFQQLLMTQMRMRP